MPHPRHEAAVSIDVPPQVEAYARRMADPNTDPELFEAFLLDCLTFDIEWQLRGDHVTVGECSPQP